MHLELSWRCCDSYRRIDPGEAELHIVHTTLDGRMAGSSLHGITAWIAGSLASSSLVLLSIFVASDLDHNYVTWSIMGVDLCLYRNTSLLSTRYVMTYCYKCICLTTRVHRRTTFPIHLAVNPISKHPLFYASVQHMNKAPLVLECVERNIRSLLHHKCKLSYT